MRVDSKKRVRLPEAGPHQVFAYERWADGRIVLSRLVQEPSVEAFPRGSLKKCLTPAKAEEELALLNGCRLEAPE